MGGATAPVGLSFGRYHHQRPSHSCGARQASLPNGRSGSSVVADGPGISACYSFRRVEHRVGGVVAQHWLPCYTLFRRRLVRTTAVRFYAAFLFIPAPGGYYLYAGSKHREQSAYKFTSVFSQLDRL